MDIVKALSFVIVGLICIGAAGWLDVLDWVVIIMGAASVGVGIGGWLGRRERTSASVQEASGD